MKPQELARWIRDEHEVVRGLSERLQEKVAIVPQANQQRWIQDLREAFDHLRAHLIKHFALEEQDGYMVSVVHRRPSLAREVDRLAHEHGEIVRLLEGIHRAAHELMPDDRLLIRDCCRRIQNFLQYWERHESDENFLVMTAFTEDIGGND
ncbi:MAG TPA: hemerythrin domain-containing protein [Phycisphaerae bacterium]|nr:hemerythrin domain-containing protein [Phycisphaerae bacterium]